VGPVLTGRYRAGAQPTSRTTGFLETGARFGAGFRHAHLELGYSRYERTGDAPSATLERFAGSLCGLASGIGLCADMELFNRGSTGVTVGRGDTAYLGIHVGVLTGQRTHAAEPDAPPPPAAKGRRSAQLVK
jgi:hypothetical protein